MGFDFWRDVFGINNSPPPADNGPDYAHGAQGGAMGHWNPDGSWTWDTGGYAGKTVPANQAQANKDLYDQSVSDPAAAKKAKDDFADKNGANGSGKSGVQGTTDLSGAIGGSLPGANSVPGGSLDLANSNAERGRMEDMLASLQQQAATGGGAWEKTLAEATKRSQQTASALGQTQANDGGSYQSGLMNIGNAQSGAAQRAVGQGNILRAKSQQQATDEIGTLLAGEGDQDLAGAAGDAAARQGVRGANQALAEEGQKATLGYIQGVGQAASTLLSDGGKVPGKPKVFGNDERNDTVPAMLSPGEVVLPRTVANNPQAAADFVRSLNTSHGVRHMADGGQAWQPGQDDPSNTGFNFTGMSTQAPSIGNGGLLDTTHVDQNRANTLAFADMLGSRSAGAGPSQSPQMLTNAQDAAVSEAMAARQRAGPTAGAAVLGETVTGEQGRGGAAAEQTQRETEAASKGQLGALGTLRGRDLSLAQAQQQAEWKNTLANVGVSLANQHLIQGIFSGAAQATGALARSGAFKSSGGGGAADGPNGGGDTVGDTSSGQTHDDPGSGVDESAGGGDETGDTSSGQTHDDPGPSMALGGTVGYADGGQVEEDYYELGSGQQVRAVPGNAPKKQIGKLTDVMHSKTPIELPDERRARKAREHEEETGDTPRPRAPVESPDERLARKAREHQEETGDTPKPKPASNDSAFARALHSVGEFAKGASASLNFAEGGGVPDDGGRPPFNPFDFDVQRSTPPVVYVSDTPVPGTRPVPLSGAGGGGGSSGAGGGPPDTGASAAGGGTSRGDYGAAGAGGAAGTSVVDRGSGGATGGPSTNEVPQHETMPPRAAPPVSLQLPPGVSPKSSEEEATATAAPPVAPAAKPSGGGGGGIPLPRQTDRGELNQQTEGAITAAADLEAQKARAEATGALERQRVANAYALKEKDAHDRATSFTNDAFTRLRAAQDEMNRVDAKVDPDRYWASKSTGQKILGVIGLTLGAIGAGSDGVNRAAQMMNQAIDRDIDAQKTEFEARLRKGGQKIAAAQSFYSMAREAGLDEIAATHAAKAAALESVAAKTDATVASINEPMAKARGQQLVLAARGGAADKTDAAKQRTFENQIQKGHLAAELEAAGRKGGLTPERQKAVDDVESATRNIRDNIAKARAIIKRSGTFELGGTDQVELERALSFVANDSARLKDPGSTVREGELDAAKKEIGLKGGEIFQRDATSQALLDSFEKSIEQRRANALRVRGIQP